MKKLIFFVLVFLTMTPTNAQTTKENEQSNAEKFSARSGTLMQKEFSEIGNLKKCKIQVLYYSDLITNSKQSALKFEFEVATTYSTDTKVAILDTDEIDGLMKSIKILQEKVIINVPANYTEAYYRSRSGFEAGCFVSKGSWSCYLKLEKFDGKSYVWLDKEDLPALYTLLEQAKVKML